MIEFGKEVVKATGRSIKPTRSRLIAAGILVIALPFGVQLGTAIRESRQPEICHRAQFPEPVMPFMPGLEPITTYCRSLPGDPPADSLIGQCFEGQKISHIIEIRLQNESTGFIPVSTGAVC